MTRHCALTILTATLATPFAGCASSPVDLAFENRVFYQHDTLPGADMSLFEARYPPLDARVSPALPEYLGYSVLGGTMRISRPRDWAIRTASNQAEQRYVQYVSPKQYLVSVYELVDAPTDLWRDVVARYEEAATKSGAELAGARVPIAAGNAQGRAFDVKRRVVAAKEPFLSRSREYLLRSEHRIVLVQIVHQSETLEEIGLELRRFVETIEVL